MIEPFAIGMQAAFRAQIKPVMWPWFRVLAPLA